MIKQQQELPQYFKIEYFTKQIQNLFRVSFYNNEANQN